MLEVKLKLNYLKLNIDEPLLLEFAIKNQQNKTITIPSFFPLIEGNANLNTTFRFLTSKKRLQLCVILFKNHDRKFAGSILIDLNKIKVKQQIEICESLKSSIPKNSQISISLTYKKSSESLHSIDLISLSDREMMKTMKQLSQQEFRLTELKEQNRKIQSEYQRVFKQNRELYEELQSMQNEHSRIKSSWQGQINFQQQELKDIVQKLQKQKIIIASVIDIVLDHGDPQLVDRIQKILGIKENHSQI